MVLFRLVIRLLTMLYLLLFFRWLSAGNSQICYLAIFSFAVFSSSISADWSCCLFFCSCDRVYINVWCVWMSTYPWLLPAVNVSVYYVLFLPSPCIFVCSVLSLLSRFRCWNWFDSLSVLFFVCSVLSLLSRFRCWMPPLIIYWETKLARYLFPCQFLMAVFRRGHCFLLM